MSAPISPRKHHVPHKPADEPPPGSKDVKKAHDSAQNVIGTGKQVNPSTGLKKAAVSRPRTSSYLPGSPVDVDAAVKRTRDRHSKSQSSEQP